MIRYDMTDFAVESIRKDIGANQRIFKIITDTLRRNRNGPRIFRNITLSSICIHLFFMEMTKNDKIIQLAYKILHDFESTGTSNLPRLHGDLFAAMLAVEHIIHAVQRDHMNLIHPVIQDTRQLLVYIIEEFRESTPRICKRIKAAFIAHGDDDVFDDPKQDEFCMNYFTFTMLHICNGLTDDAKEDLFKKSNGMDAAFDMALLLASVLVAKQLGICPDIKGDSFTVLNKNPGLLTGILNPLLHIDLALFHAQ